MEVTIRWKVFKAMVMKGSGKDGEQNKETANNEGFSNNILRHQLFSCFSAIANLSH